MKYTNNNYPKINSESSIQNEEVWISEIKLKKRSCCGFTLVELIIVIVILAILSTIAFIQMNSFNSNARDSARRTDISLIKTALETSYIKISSYPLPSEPLKTVTYSWGIAFYEGTFGESVSRQLQSLNKYIVDPLYKDVNYTYSIINNKKQYQIWYITENPTAYISPIIDTTFASSVLSQIDGIYSGSIIVSTGVTNSVYNTPTIISSLYSSGVYDIEDLSGVFVTDESWVNIPFSYLTAIPPPPIPPVPPAEISINFSDTDGINVSCPDCVTY